MRVGFYRVTAIFLACGVLGGCAPMISGAMNASVDEQQALTDTAYYFGVSESAIQIENFEKHTLASTYRAYIDDTMYNCRIYYGEVECKKPGEGTW